MLRSFLVALAAVALVAPVRADRIAPISSPIERALRAPVVVLGKVTSVEKEPVEAALYPGATNKVSHKIAVVKVETNLLGADGATHLRVGFVPVGAEGVRPGRGPDNPALAEGQEWLFFLVKHHDGGFHAIPYMTPPVDLKAEGAKAQTESVKKVLAVVADPTKALKADKLEDRTFAALALVTKYRSPTEGVREVAPVAIPADESKLILTALAAGEWKPDPRGGRFNATTAFFQLGLTEADGWKSPVAKPGEDFHEALRQAFAKWTEGAGKDYRIKKLVPKTK